MATNAVIENGKLMNAGFTESSSKAAENTSAKDKDSVKKNSGMDKNAFMKILVAQMKYQDPMQPTSNTEYIAQYAQFSQVEALDNMSKTMEQQRASQLVGQYVTLDNSSVAGEGATVSGMVDYVTYSGSKMYFNIGGNSYDVETLISVDSLEYKNAKELVDSLEKRIEKLPFIDQMDYKDTEEVYSIYEVLQKMTDYEKKYLGSGIETAVMNYKLKADDVVEIYKANAEREALLNQGMIPLDNETSAADPEPEVTDEQIAALVEDQETKDT